MRKILLWGKLASPIGAWAKVERIWAWRMMSLDVLSITRCKGGRYLVSGMENCKCLDVVCILARLTNLLIRMGTG